MYDLERRSDSRSGTLCIKDRLHYTVIDSALATLKGGAKGTRPSLA